MSQALLALGMAPTAGMGLLPQTQGEVVKAAVVCAGPVRIGGLHTPLRKLCRTLRRAAFLTRFSFNVEATYGNLGSVLSTQERNSEAEIAFKKALEYRPNMADVHYNL
ncbi:jg23915 [Pararge aegeria aegeria]|uniref:Jg23915 protein n=1 Tax=Pararge aegeria aegeria TaxID=348720 RepID=A0A8S4S2M6_9NEOP|nr:jg23915 [Pararge aegeria aegeria]